MTATAVHSFATSQEAIPLLTSSIKSGDIVLVKGSQSMRMEHIVKALMAEPERASELLVRQEKEWLRKI
jgi:UDP-N-acetylmuramyl pentapeptide synthase